MNKYEVLSSVGEGTYGLVLKCRHRATGEVVAIKKFKDPDDEEAAKKTTLREVRVLRLLRSRAGIVDLKEAFRRKGRLYLVFEYVGPNLLEVLARYRPGGLPPSLVRRYTFMLLHALQACHAARILHRDVKPENLLVRDDDHSLKLCDFGFARHMDDDGYTDYVATRWYRSPELLLGTTRYDEKVDTWAAGCILAEMATGSPLFPGESEAGQLCLVQKRLGDMTDAQVARFRRNPRFTGCRLPSEGAGLGVETPFHTLLGAQGLCLLKGLLSLDPSVRLSAAEGVRHPWFAGLQEDAWRTSSSSPPLPSSPPDGASLPSLVRAPNLLFLGTRKASHPLSIRASGSDQPFSGRHLTALIRSHPPAPHRHQLR